MNNNKSKKTRENRMSMKGGWKCSIYTLVCAKYKPKSLPFLLARSSEGTVWLWTANEHVKKNWFIEPPTHLFLLTAYQKFTPNKMRISKNNNNTTATNNGQVKKGKTTKKSYDDGGGCTRVNKNWYKSRIKCEKNSLRLPCLSLSLFTRSKFGECSNEVHKKS